MPPANAKVRACRPTRVPRSSAAKIVALRRRPKAGDEESASRRSRLVDARSIPVRLTLSTRAAERLARSVASGHQRYVLVLADGSLSLGVHLSIDAAHLEDQRTANGKFGIDWARATVSNGRSCTTLSRTELRLLGGLLDGNGAPVSRADLIARAWPRDRMPVAERNNALAVYVCTLRKRLKGIGVTNALETVRGVGYRLAID